MNNNKNQIQRLDTYLTEYVNFLKQTAPNKTGKLSESFEFTIGQTPDRFDIGIYGMSYAKFMDAGVNGTLTDRGSQFSFKDKMPPISAFPQATNPWAVAKSIQAKGIAGTRFISNTVDEKVNELADELIKGIWEDFKEQEDLKNKNEK